MEDLEDLKRDIYVLVAQMVKKEFQDEVVKSRLQGFPLYVELFIMLNNEIEIMILQ